MFPTVYVNVWEGESLFQVIVLSTERRCIHTVYMYLDKHPVSASHTHTHIHLYVHSRPQGRCAHTLYRSHLKLVYRSLLTLVSALVRTSALTKIVGLFWLCIKSLSAVY